MIRQTLYPNYYLPKAHVHWANNVSDHFINVSDAEHMGKQNIHRVDPTGELEH